MAIRVIRVSGFPLMVTVLLLFSSPLSQEFWKRTRLAKGVQVERVVINALATTAALRSDELFALIRVIRG